MDIKHHIGFRNKQAPELLSYLKEHSICFSEDNVMSSFEIVESNPHWERISYYVRVYGLIPITETVFSKEELSQAEWLRVRSVWKNGYPQPENDFKYEQITYSDKLICRECGCGLMQVNPFRLKKQPNWGVRHFFELNWVGDELFVSNIAKDILEKSNISGIGFEVVMDKQGKNTYANVNQLVVPYILNKGFASEKTDLKEHSVCSQCGERKYIYSGRGRMAFKKETFLNVPNVVKTFEKFGSGHYATRYLIIRQNVYQTISANHLDRGLVFEPIELV